MLRGSSGGVSDGRYRVAGVWVAVLLAAALALHAAITVVVVLLLVLLVLLLLDSRSGCAGHGRHRSLVLRSIGCGC